MNTEVEIKFIVKPQVKSRLQSLLDNYEIIENTIKPLSSTYFDTTTYQFRQLDFGLRTRKSLNFAEQTIKTAGTVRGGLHQRPEYNLPLFGDLPTLAKFPAEIWPADIDVGQLQANLVELFTTDFERTLWHIKLANNAEVEVVFDQGMVHSGDESYPICEIELELISGNIDDLFSLAQKIVQLGDVRLGNVSKAKRGYQLAGLYTPSVQALTLQMPASQHESLADIFLFTLAQSYAHWQHHEQLYLETQDVYALAEVLVAIELIQQTMETYAQVIPETGIQKAELDWLRTQLCHVDSVVQIQQVITNNGHFIRNFPEHKRIVKELIILQHHYLDFAAVDRLLHTSRYAEIMLAISQLLNQEKIQLIMSGEENVRAFADQHLQISWQDVLNSSLSKLQLNVDDYLQIKCKLQHNLLIGLCFSHLYSAALRDKFCLPWMDILQGIDDLAVLQMLMTVAECQPELIAKQIYKILQRKQDSLLDALEQTRHQALTMEPYWLSASH